MKPTITVLWQHDTRPNSLTRYISIWLWDETNGPTALMVHQPFRFQNPLQHVKEVLVDHHLMAPPTMAPSGGKTFQDKHIRYFELE